MKKVFCIILFSLFSVSLFANSPGTTIEKAKQAFKKAFPSVKTADWFDNGDTYLVRFVSDGIDSRIVYDEKGEVISTTRCYDETHLPAFIKDKLQKKFKDKKVYTVTENTSPEGLEYYLTLYDAKKWYMVRSTDSGIMEVYDKFNRQLP